MRGERVCVEQRGGAGRGGFNPSINPRTVLASETGNALIVLSLLQEADLKKKKTYLKRKSVISSRAPNEFGFWME